MSEHIVSRKVYFGIFGALIALTFTTVLVARYDFGHVVGLQQEAELRGPRQPA